MPAKRFSGRILFNSYGASTARKNRLELLVTLKPSTRSWLPVGTTALVNNVHWDMGSATFVVV